MYVILYYIYYIILFQPTYIKNIKIYRDIILAIWFEN